jgi:hypothetical protein
MNNFPYIIAGLPQLALDFESRKSNFETLADSIYVACGESDRRLIDWLFFGLKEENLNHFFYKKVITCKNRFLREYFEFDLNLRNIKVAYLSRKFKLQDEPRFIGDSMVTESLRTSKAPDFGLSLIINDAAQILQVMDMQNILEREQQLDLLRWNKAGEICTFGLFDIDTILCFLFKASVADRWSRLDRAEGAKFLNLLISELRSKKI